MGIKASRIVMSEIVDLLNELIEKQPGMSALFDHGLPASEEIQSMTTIYCRPTITGEDWVTVVGVISAIGRILGKEDGMEIRSVWNVEGDDRHLTGFQIGPSQGQILGQSINEEGSL
jgi:hypothetical protein